MLAACLVHIDDLLHDVLHETVRRLDAGVDGGITEELAGHVDGLVVNVRQQICHTSMPQLFCTTYIHTPI